MSCCYQGCQCGCSNSVPYCSPILPQQESVASQLENLSTNLFGPFTKTIKNGRGIWTGLCSITSVIPGFPRSDNEGFICYILRYLSPGGILKSMAAEGIAGGDGFNDAEGQIGMYFGVAAPVNGSTLIAVNSGIYLNVSGAAGSVIYKTSNGGTTWTLVL